MAEITGFVLLGRELQRAHGQEPLGVRDLVQRVVAWARREPPPPLPESQSWPITMVGASLAMPYVVVQEVPPPGDSLASVRAHFDARLANLEALRDAMEQDQEQERRALEHQVDEAHGVARGVAREVATVQEQAEASARAEARARTWFIGGVFLATLGGVVGNL